MRWFSFCILGCSPCVASLRDLRLPQKASLLKGYGFTASSDMLCFNVHLQMCEFIFHLFFFWECHWTDNASASVSLTDSVSVWRPAGPMGHTNMPFKREAYWGQKTFKWMQLMTVRHIFQCDLVCLHTSEPQLLGWLVDLGNWHTGEP